jgi:hypothetical protein
MIYIFSAIVPLWGGKLPRIRRIVVVISRYTGGFRGGCAISAKYSLTSAELASAAAIRELPAERSPFQRIQPNFPPTQIVNSADLAELPARHFGR